MIVTAQASLEQGLRGFGPLQDAGQVRKIRDFSMKTRAYLAPLSFFYKWTHKTKTKRKASKSPLLAVKNEEIADIIGRKTGCRRYYQRQNG